MLQCYFPDCAVCDILWGVIIRKITVAAAGTFCHICPHCPTLNTEAKGNTQRPQNPAEEALWDTLVTPRL